MSGEREKLHNKEKSKEKDPSQGGTLAQPTDVDPKEMDKEIQEKTLDLSFVSEESRAVLDDIIADYGTLGGEGFDVHVDYDGLGARGEARNIDTVLVLPIISLLDGEVDKDIIKHIEDFADENADNLQVLGQLIYVLSHPAMQATFQEHKKIQRLVKDIERKIIVFQEAAVEKQEEEKNKEEREQMNAQKEVVEVLFGLSTLPTTKEGLVQYADHLDEFQMLLSDKEKFTILIEHLKQEVKTDETKDKNQKEGILTNYDQLLANFDFMTMLVLQLETILYGMSVSKLLEKTKTMTREEIATDPDCLRAMNTIFHMDREKYNEFITYLQAEDETALKIMRAYVSKEDPSLDAETIDFVLRDNASINLYQDGEKLVDSDGDGIALFFGIEDGEGYRPATFQDIFNDTGWKGKLLADMIASSPSDSNTKSDEKVDETTAQPKKPKSLSEALSAMWNSGIWREMQKILLSLDGIDGRVDATTEVKLAYLHALDAIEKERKEHKDQYTQYLKSGQDINTVDIIAAANAYKFASYQVPDEEGKIYQSTDVLSGEKNFFATLSVEEQIRYILNRDQRTAIQSGQNSLVADKGEVVSLDSFEKSYDPSVRAEEITQPSVGSSEALPLQAGETSLDRPMNITSLKRSKEFPGYVEYHAEDAGNPYLLVDGQAVGLTVDETKTKAIGSYPVLEEGGKVIIRRVTITLPTIYDYDVVKIDVSTITLTEDKQKEFDAFYDGQSNRWDISGLMSYKDNLVMREMFIARALQLPDTSRTNPAMQKVMAGLQHDVFTLDEKEVSVDTLKKLFDRSYHDMLALTDNLTTDSTPSKTDAGKTIAAWYATVS